MATPGMEQGGVGGAGAQVSLIDKEPGDLLPCYICGRTFLARPLRTHVRICEKNATKKRKVFNSLKQRIQGTDLAEFHHGSHAKVPGSPAPARSRWKEKHEALVACIKAAKGTQHPQVQQPQQQQTAARTRRSTAAVGTMGVTERCPWCERQFGPKSFDRHVEWCRERASHAQRSPAAAQERIAAKERLEARTKYRVPPPTKSRRSVTRDKYSGPMGSRTESLASVRSSASVPSVVRHVHGGGVSGVGGGQTTVDDHSPSSPGASAAAHMWTSTPRPGRAQRLHVQVTRASAADQPGLVCSAEQLMSACTLADDCHMLAARGPLEARRTHCELEIEVYGTCDMSELEETRGDDCLPGLSHLLATNRIRNVKVLLPETAGSAPKPRVFVKREGPPSHARLPQLQLQSTQVPGGRNKKGDGDSVTCLPIIKCSKESLNKSCDFWEKCENEKRRKTYPKLKRGSTFVKLSPVLRDKASDSETVRSASDSELRPASPHFNPDPFVTAEKQLRELLQCGDGRSNGGRARISLGGILGTPVSAPASAATVPHRNPHDDFELLENYINDNFDDNGNPDELTSIDPKLINANDDLHIPEHFLAGDYSPVERVYSAQYGKKISVVEPLGFPKRALKHTHTDTIDDIDFDEFMSSFNEDEFILPIADKPVSRRKLTRSVDSCSSGVSPVASSGGKQQQLSPIRRSLSVSSPAVKARSLRTKQDIQEYLHPPALAPGATQRSSRPSGDSAYGSLNRMVSAERKPRQSRSGSKLLAAERSPSSSGSDTAPPSAPPSVTKFCHECGSRFPIATAKFCVECGVRRLVL